MPIRDYDKQIFINCPFDDRYAPMLEAIVFAVYDCGFRPRCAKEFEDCGNIRIDAIIGLIKECRFGIHDISRTELDPKNSLPRFNMPYELGLFVGATKFGSRVQSGKRLLILDREQYRYQRYLSDIGGQDIKAHGDEPELVIPIVRNWLKASSEGLVIPGGATIQKRYIEFKNDLPKLCRKSSIGIKELTYNDRADLLTCWLESKPKKVEAA